MVAEAHPKAGAARGAFCRSRLLGWVIVLLLGGTSLGRAVLQFDVFLGYDTIVPEACWFPVVCEIKNDGPGFTGVIEVTPANLNQGQVRRLKVELPTGTLKRLVIPVFSAARGSGNWDVRLYDERGKLREERASLGPRRRLAPGTPVIGALARTPGGTPQIQPILPQAPELQPAAARLLPSIFPDNPLVLEGLDCLYLNSEKASDLGVNQVNALLAWLHAGGHLIVGIEQPSDITSSPWLKSLFPCELKESRSVQPHPDLQQWLKSATWSTVAIRNPSSQPTRYSQYGGSSRTRPEPPPGATPESPFSQLADDLNFEMAPLQVAAGQMRDGRVVVSANDIPLIISANRGRGRLTALMFSPEREPARSWKNLPVLWAKLAEVPGSWYASADFAYHGGPSSDGIFGAMLETRQVHKLPVQWLLLLLIVYLVVIGPFDQYWLKRIGRPMLTWITFPCYVVAFSLVIYFIGYKLRAGESEWNELHVVDVLAKGEEAELRGRTYASVYSPVNQRYALDSQQKYATLRGESFGMWGGGGQSLEKATILQEGDSFKADVFVPVWASQLLVNDWWQSAPLPLKVTVSPQGEGWRVKVENLTDRKLSQAQVAIGDFIMPLGEVRPEEAKVFNVTWQQGKPLQDFVTQTGQGFEGAVQSRQQAFGRTEPGHIEDLPNSSMAVSFLSRGLVRQHNYSYTFTTPPGLDLAPALEHGQAVLLAWVEDYAPVKPIYHFSPRRHARHTLWRCAIEIR